MEGFTIRRLGPDDGDSFDGMLTLLGQAFEDEETYNAARPGPAYRQRLLGKRDFVALVAIAGNEVIGALAAYELLKFEQERSEFYIYDLAVRADWRRRGVATALIRDVQRIAREAGAWVVFVQADYGDDPAVALYTKLGAREDVMHFDLPLDGPL